MSAFWQSLSQSARLGLIVGCVVILSMTAGIAWWFLKTDYQVLFSDMKPQDAAVITTELEKLKIPYQVSDSGSVILVDKTQVHATRLKVMGKDLPLHGAVGFELFNNSDFGMTEFAQKINYQRALQGELTRTILSLAEIWDARVHLVLPEQGLFKQASAKPKAAITLMLREGKTLSPLQVNGIQRLVAAATPGMTAQDVTVLDKQGMALSRLTEDGAGSSVATIGNGNAQLELKKETEAQLMKKASAVLDKAFGPEQALVSVDVTLNLDQIHTTTEDVTPAPSNSAGSKGVIVKERESVRDTSVAPLDATRVNSVGSGGSTQREVDYQVGRRVEQVVSAVGTVRRIQVAAVVKQSMDSLQEEQVRQLLAAAVGASIERGDTVVVQSLRVLGAGVPVASANNESAVDTARNNMATEMTTNKSDGVIFQLTAWFTAIVLILIAIVAFSYFLRRNSQWHRRKVAMPLSEAERQALLHSVQNWMQQGSLTTGVREESLTGVPKA